MKKRDLIKVLGTMAVIAAVGVGSTMAYLTDKTDTLTNVFTVGNIELQLKESNVVHDSEDGYLDNDGEVFWTVDFTTDYQYGRKNGVDYSECAPNEIILKDPTVFANTSVKSLIYVYLKNAEVVNASAGTIRTKVVETTDKSLQFTLEDCWEIYEDNAKDGIILKYKTQDGNTFTWYDPSDGSGNCMPIFKECVANGNGTTEIPKDAERGATFQDLDIQALGVQAKYVSGDATVEKQIIKDNTDWLN
ncbi:SipW-cognate class signal peptide [Acetitomaculum ruminis DSM 5522]|uniref:SipW-cognate class signal peptide n=1 Tax=Acetitomaculum ruminis DSM 5522 TaxID=1120918 RepID=A0A1I0XQU8_9FIRM|nr:SipW-dependent-type signal peptide-containing protein [Acetitomaculum ruminis]SFB03047.1 SipW-cognate class signal peptide [Acetitomaculum ruminis DSM 5522]